MKTGGCLAVLSVLGACGTAYTVPVAGDAEMGQARAMFAQERDPSTALSGRRLEGGMALSQYREVVRRVEPVAEAFCRQEAADKPAFDCDVTIVVDGEADYRNAFQTYDDAGKPIVGFTLPMIEDARNPDELAFVLGHEFGHHIAEHVKKSQQQQVAGMLVLGALTAYAQVQATEANPYRSTVNDSYDMQRAMVIGGELGGRAFSQTYELESDTLGTYITKAAGYDPVVGARFFARPEKPQTADGSLSFWGTHPPSETRLATVLATAARIDAGETTSPERAD